MKPVFLAFVCHYDDSAYGEGLPVAGVVRIDPHQIPDALKRAEQAREWGSYVGAVLDPSNVRWLSQVGLDETGEKLGPIPGFYDPERDTLVDGGSLDELDLEDDVDIGDCVVHAGGVVDPVLTVNIFGDELNLVLSADCRDFWIESLAMPWDEARQALKDAGAPLETVKPAKLDLDEQEIATLLAALTHYVRTGQGEPDHRTEEIHLLATGINDSVISLDDVGIEDLLVKIKTQVAASEAPQPFAETDAARADMPRERG